MMRRSQRLPPAMLSMTSCITLILMSVRTMMREAVLVLRLNLN